MNIKYLLESLTCRNPFPCQSWPILEKWNWGPLSHSASFGTSLSSARNRCRLNNLFFQKVRFVRKVELQMGPFILFLLRCSESLKHCWWKDTHTSQARISPGSLMRAEIFSAASVESYPHYPL